VTVADRYMPDWIGDTLINPGPDWTDCWDLRLINERRKKPFNKRFIDLMIARKQAVKTRDRKKVQEIDRRLRAANYRKEVRAVNTLYRNFCKWEIDDKIKEGYTFGVERRKYKKSGKVYNGYLYRQKRINGKKEHICLRARNLEDFRENVLWDRAQEQVFGDRWVLRDLSPSEIDTFRIIESETTRHKNYDRDPIIERYRKQLGMKCRRKKHGINLEYATTTKSHSIQERKRLLQAARKAIAKQREVDNKIVEIGIKSGEGNGSLHSRNSFIRSLISESRCRHSTEALKDYIKLQIEEKPYSVYSILKPNELGLFAERAIWLHKKLQSRY
jgi:hypothetical protein